MNSDSILNCNFSKNFDKQEYITRFGVCNQCQKHNGAISVLSGNNLLYFCHQCLVRYEYHKKEKVKHNNITIVHSRED